MEKRLPLSDGGYTLLKTVHTVPGAYSELFYLGESGPGIGRLIVDPYKQVLYSTRPDDIAAIKASRQKGLSLDASIKARIKAFEELASQEYQKRAETREIYIPPGPRLGDVVIEVKDLMKKFGDRVLYSGVNFTVPRGAIVGIIGANGMGKTTLFKILTGQEQPDGGSVRIGETVKFAYVDQSRDALKPENTVFEEVAGKQDILKIGNLEVPSRAYIGRFNFKGEAQQKRMKELSGGERNRVHLAKLLLSGGNTLLLDEPTNDLDVETLRALEEAILDFPGCALVISHDRWFLDRVATHILAFEDSGEVVWHEGNYRDYEDDFRRRTGSEPGVNRRSRHKKLA